MLDYMYIDSIWQCDYLDLELLMHAVWTSTGQFINSVEDSIFDALICQFKNKHLYIPASEKGMICNCNFTCNFTNMCT